MHEHTLLFGYLLACKKWYDFSSPEVKFWSIDSKYIAGFALFVVCTDILLCNRERE